LSGRLSEVRQPLIFFSTSSFSVWRKVTRNRIIAASAAITVLFVAVSRSAYARSKGTEASQSAPTKVNEQGYFALCSLPLESLLQVNPDGLVLIKICTLKER
jgi:hypothetical protein